MKQKIHAVSLQNFVRTLKNLNLVFLFSLISHFSIGQNKTYNIDDPEDLRNEFYQPGDLIILKNGTYTTDERMRFLGSGTAENPVTFRAETPGGVIFTGGPRLTIGGETEDGVKVATGEYLIVDGFHWKGGFGASNFIEFRNGYDLAHHSTIQNCVIDGLKIEPDDLADDIAEGSITKHRWIVLFGTYNTVINCSFMNKNSAGAIVLAEYAYNAWAPPYDEPEDGEPDNGFETVNTRCNLVGHIISNNYFFNFEKMDATKSNAGDSETIRIGTSEYQNINSGATVSNNYFVQADGENEIITNKSKNNKYINNTFRRSRGSLVLRHGSNATVEGNYFLGENVDGTGGIRITDSDHTIKNNYIQDCVTIASQAKWNNGITFIGGGDNAAVDCTSTSVSNGYQKSQNITLTNNTIINTNAPLFYNTDKGKNKVTGSVTNNLIYFTPNNQNITDIITGDTATSYNDLGTSLVYTDNVYNQGTLGVVNAGITEDSGITATGSGEIFTFTGNGTKGADMGAYLPATDSMVGHGIGACFLDFEGNNITDGDCTIEIPESITVSSLPQFTADASSSDVSVVANVGWTAVSNDDWITIDVNSGTGNTTVSVSVTANTIYTDRTGTVTFTQDAGGDDIVRTLNVSQAGLVFVRTNLINVGGENDPVSVKSFSSDNPSKGEVATNTLDKDMNSIWAAKDGDVVTGDYKGDGEYIIYDLGDEYSLDFIQFNTTNKGDAFGFQIFVSTTGVDDANFTKVLPTTGDVLFTATNTTDFNEFEVNTKARYVKIVGFGRYNSDGNSRKSAWSTIGEIEFFGDSTSLSNSEHTLESLGFNVYPIPVKNNILFVEKSANTNFNTLKIYSLIGQKVLSKKLNSNDSKEEINVSSLKSGIYFVEINNRKQKAVKKILITE